MLVDITQMSQYPDGKPCLTAQKSAVMNEPTTLEAIFTRVQVFSTSWQLMKLLAMLTGCLDQSVNLFSTRPPWPISQVESMTSKALWAVRDDSQPPCCFLPSQSVI